MTDLINSASSARAANCVSSFITIVCKSAAHKLVEGKDLVRWLAINLSTRNPRATCPSLFCFCREARAFNNTYVDDMASAQRPANARVDYVGKE